jgi:hypothetical protein
MRQSVQEKNYSRVASVLVTADLRPIYVPVSEVGIDQISFLEFTRCNVDRDCV